jgi:hypothetical protein
MKYPPSPSPEVDSIVNIALNPWGNKEIRGEDNRSLETGRNMKRPGAGRGTRTLTVLPPADFEANF